MKTIHRILTPILSFLVFPASIFLPLFRIMISTGLSSNEDVKSNLLNSFGLSEFISLKDLYNSYLASKDPDSKNILTVLWQALSGEKKQEILDSVTSLHWGAVFLAFFVIVLLIALALIIVSAATKKPAASFFLSVAGAVSAFVMNASFDAFAKPFVSGKVNLNTILGISNQFLGNLLGNVVKMDYMKLGIAYSAIILVFVCAAILSICAIMERKNEDK